MLPATFLPVSKKTLTDEGSVRLTTLASTYSLSWDRCVTFVRSLWVWYARCA